MWSFSSFFYGTSEKKVISIPLIKIEIEDSGRPRLFFVSRRSRGYEFWLNAGTNLFVRLTSLFIVKQIRIFRDDITPCRVSKFVNKIISRVVRHCVSHVTYLRENTRDAASTVVIRGLYAITIQMRSETEWHRFFLPFFFFFCSLYSCRGTKTIHRNRDNDGRYGGVALSLRFSNGRDGLFALRRNSLKALCVSVIFFFFATIGVRTRATCACGG